MVESIVAPLIAKLYTMVWLLLCCEASAPAQLIPPEVVEPGNAGLPMMFVVFGWPWSNMKPVSVYESPLLPVLARAAEI